MDDDGDDSDWIEIYNPRRNAVDLGGWFLSNDTDNLTQWSFPAGTVLKREEYLIVFASGKDRNDPNVPQLPTFNSVGKVNSWPWSSRMVSLW